jgi:DNA-binding Xre family transcriptional regulator
MGVDFSRLWGLIGARKINQVRLQAMVRERGGTLSLSTLNKMRKNQRVSLQVLEDIGRVLGCRIEDIVEFVDEVGK